MHLKNNPQPSANVDFYNLPLPENYSYRAQYRVGKVTQVTITIEKQAGGKKSTVTSPYNTA